MCIAILRVRYKNKSDGTQYIEFDDEDAMKSRVEDLKKNELVDSLALFSRKWKQNRISTWEICE